MRLDRLRNDAAGAIAAAGGEPIALVCSQALRRPLARTLDSLGVGLPVIAYPELPPHIELTPIGVIEHGEPAHT